MSACICRLTVLLCLSSFYCAGTHCLTRFVLVRVWICWVLVIKVKFRFQLFQVPSFPTSAFSVRGAAPFQNETSVWCDGMSHLGDANWHLNVRENIAAWAAPIY
jgi:hypothetical protein